MLEEQSKMQATPIVERWPDAAIDHWGGAG